MKATTKLKGAAKAYASIREQCARNEATPSVSDGPAHGEPAQSGSHPYLEATMQKKKYDLCFTYVGNNEVYSDCLELTDAEAVTLESALQRLVDAGYIQNPDDASGIENMLTPYSEPVFLSLDQLKRNWKAGSLADVLAVAGFSWPQTGEPPVRRAGASAAPNLNKGTR